MRPGSFVDYKNLLMRGEFDNIDDLTKAWTILLDYFDKFYAIGVMDNNDLLGLEPLYLNLFKDLNSRRKTAIFQKIPIF
jgi:hypothetical protein